MEYSISAVVLTKNEEKNIDRCLSSLVWCDEIVIVDDYSQDETIEKVKSQKSRQRRGSPKAAKVKSQKIFQRHLNGDFAAQRNFGLKKAKGHWVLFVDADEIVSKKLKKEISHLINRTDRDNILNGYFIKRRDFFMGKWLRYGETANVKLVRLAKKGAGIWRGRVHEQWEIKGKIGLLKKPLFHYPHATIAEFLQQINLYTDLVAQCWIEEGRIIQPWEIIIFPVVKFIQNYILRQGFRDGTQGIIMAVFMSFHSFLARGKYWISLHHKNKSF